MILDEEGRILAQVTLAAGVEEEVLARAFAAPIPSRPHLGLLLREGLPERLEADAPCSLTLVEEDRFARPPLLLRRLEAEGDPAGLEALLARGRG